MSGGEITVQERMEEVASGGWGSQEVGGVGNYWVGWKKSGGGKWVGLAV